MSLCAFLAGEYPLGQVIQVCLSPFTTGKERQIRKGCLERKMEDSNKGNCSEMKKAIPLI